MHVFVSSKAQSEFANFKGGKREDWIIYSAVKHVISPCSIEIQMNASLML